MKLDLSSSGVIWRRDRKLLRRVTAYELTCLRRLSPKAALEYDPPRDVMIGHGLRDLVQGDVCYAFYAKPTHKVKLGRTTSLPERWRQLELSSGMLLQLMSVWHCSNSRELESRLFAHYSEYRTVGEWFNPEAVINDLKSWTVQQRWSLDLKEPS